jgi:hypothetical protein
MMKAITLVVGGIITFVFLAWLAHYTERQNDTPSSSPKL